MQLVKNYIQLQSICGPLPIIRQITWEPGTVTILHHGTCVSVAKAIANVAAVYRLVKECNIFQANHNGVSNWIEPRC